jgi:hypothetical protein
MPNWRLLVTVCHCCDCSERLQVPVPASIRGSNFWDHIVALDINTLVMKLGSVLNVNMKEGWMDGGRCDVETCYCQLSTVSRSTSRSLLLGLCSIDLEPRSGTWRKLKERWPLTTTSIFGANCSSVKNSVVKMSKDIGWNWATGIDTEHISAV